ncbi:hypothetical protein J6Z19_00255 [bacterium]|nr:hypothetical protein [bacterium]
MKKSFLILFFLLPAVIFAESFAPEVQNSEIFTGDEVVVKIKIAPSENITAAFSEKFDDAKIRKIEVTPEKDAVLLKIVVFKSGEVEIPEINISSGGVSGKIEPFSIDVKTRTEEGDTELRGLKDNAAIKEKDYTLLYVLAALIVAAVIAVLLFKLKKRFAKKAEEKVPEVVPAEVAKEFIKKAEAKRKEGDFESFTDLVTLGLKTYMSLKSKKNYVEMTTFEVKRALKRDHLFSADSEAVLSILKLADRYKFADEPLKPEDFDSLIDGFKDFLKKKETGNVSA